MNLISREVLRLNLSSPQETTGRGETRIFREALDRDLIFVYSECDQCTNQMVKVTQSGNHEIHALLIFFVLTLNKSVII